MKTEEGIVTKSTGNIHLVRNSQGEFACRLKGQFRIKGIKSTNPIAVGDHVLFHIESNQDYGLITNILERTNCIYRKSTNLSKITHVIAANIDTAFLIVSMSEPCTPIGFIDRFLVAAEAFRIPTCIVFNKHDIYNNDTEDYAKKIQTIYTSIGYECIYTSVPNQEGISLLADKMKNKVSLFCGQSGVGKSSIINCISPELHLKIGTVSNYNEKGKHTTTFSQMHQIGNGGYIIDTPGIKEFGLIQYQKEEVCHYFPEMLDLLEQCQFSNCTHTHEPNCAIKQAVDDNKIFQSRYNSYLSIIENEDINKKEWMFK